MKEGLASNEKTNNHQESREKRKETLEIKIGENTYPLEVESYDFEYPKNIQEETGILGYERTKINKEQLDENLELKNVLDYLSNGEYPRKCLVHVLDGYSSTRESHKNFVHSKFFVQKIYDIDYIKNQVGQLDDSHKKRSIFNAVASPDQVGNLQSNISIFDKETGEKVTEGDFEPISVIGEKKYYDDLRSGKLFACTPYSGLNVMRGEFFHSHNVKLSESSPSFGFSAEYNSFYYKYLQKALSIYIKELKGINSKNEQEGIKSVIKTLILNNFLFKKKDLDIINQGKSDDEIIESFTLLINATIEEFESEYSVKIDDFYSKEQISGILRRHGAKDYYSHGEERLPVFIGRNDIPQLSWGHAKYAHYTNEKGFNFFKFKHSEHLPIKKTSTAHIPE